MGREIRKVPPNWDHPKVERYGRVEYQPMCRGSYAEAEAEWLATLDRYRQNGMGKDAEYYPTIGHWAKDEQFPDPAYYVPWAKDQATWFQAWETVSEGTPVSPPFATQEELIDYLAANGDFWDQDRCKKPDWTRLWGGEPGVSAWGRERAERFVKAAWAPSFVVSGGVMTPGTAAV